MSKTIAPAIKNKLSDLAKSLEPWPLGTEAFVRALAWPDYSNQEELQKILDVAEPLFGRDDACLCLRHDRTVDIPLDHAVRAVEDALAAYGRQEELQVLIIDDEIPQGEWVRVGMTAFCAILTTEDTTSVRFQFINAQGVQIIRPGG